MEDLDALMVAAGQAAFAVPHEIAHAVGGPWYSIAGIFDRRWVEVLMEDGAPQNMRRVTLSVSMADLPVGFTPRKGDLVRQSGPRTGLDLWQVMDLQPDSMGGAVLILGARAGKVGA